MSGKRVKYSQEAARFRRDEGVEEGRILATRNGSQFFLGGGEVRNDAVEHYSDCFIYCAESLLLKVSLHLNQLIV